MNAIDIKIQRTNFIIMKSTAKANGKNLDGMIYSTFRTSYRVHSQAKTTTQLKLQI